MIPKPKKLLDQVRDSIRPIKKSLQDRTNLPELDQAVHSLKWQATPQRIDRWRPGNILYLSGYL